LLATEHAVGFGIVWAMFGRGLPSELATELHRNVAEVSDRGGAMADFRGCVGLGAVQNGVGEIEVLATASLRFAWNDGAEAIELLVGGNFHVEHEFAVKPGENVKLVAYPCGRRFSLADFEIPPFSAL
jgi:hypothetical protein